ncbi:MAG TPA: GNAT family N-acetyltransferase [Bacillota bacterium]|nr:GNAT family N-acetyltransferase [Bacillota bacterium]
MNGNVQVRNPKIRFAGLQDLSLVLSFIKALADYEHLADEVRATEESLRDILFERRVAESVIAELNGEAVGFAVIYYSLSTFIGKPGLFIEDLFVRPETRGMGVGKKILAFLAQLAKERGCWGLEWSCLDWNDASIRFYEGIGAVPRPGWTIYRLCDDALNCLADTTK